MTRTIITLSDEDKKWLEHYSHVSHQSIAKTIRVAITFYRTQQKTSVKKDALSKTAGLWRARRKDALDHVEDLRREWDRTA